MGYEPKKAVGWYSWRNNMICESYREGQTTSQIADKWHLAASTVCDILKGYGIEIVWRRN